jgi:hypothetical protein
MTTLPVLPELPDTRIDSPLPVLNYSAGAGWHSWGNARTEAAARRIVTANLPASSRSLVNTYGFRVTVTLRTALQRELNGGPDGFVWSVSK